MPLKKVFRITETYVVENEGYFWGEHSEEYMRAVVFKAESFSDVYFNSVFKRLIGLTLSTWGAMTRDKMLSSIAATDNRGLRASLAGVLPSGVQEGLFTKAGDRGSAKYGLSQRQTRNRRIYGWSPSSEAMAIAMRRAFELKRNYEL